MGICLNVQKQPTMTDKPRWMDTIEEMDDHEFQQWSRLLKQRTGMEVKNSRKSFLTTGVRLRMRELGYTSYNKYYHYLLRSGPNGKMEWATLVDRLTIHETRFFRHPNATDLVTDIFLPKYLEQHRQKESVLAWSVGCATGEESYSLAIALDDYLTQYYKSIYYGVVGSDISLPALATARKGIYEPRRLKNLSYAHHNRYLTAVDGGCYQVNKALRQRVCFNMFNLLEMEQSIINDADIIFCQNVLIYFDSRLRASILNKLVNYLNPGGLLVIGVGEALDWKHPQMKRVSGVDALAYTKENHNGDQ